MYSLMLVLAVVRRILQVQVLVRVLVRMPSLVLVLGLVAVATTDLGSDVPQLAAAKQALGELVSR